MTAPTTMNDSSLINAAISSIVHQVAEAAAAAVFENGVEKLPPPIHTIFFLGNKHDRKLSIIMGEVKISSISMPENHNQIMRSRTRSSYRQCEHDKPPNVRKVRFPPARC